MNWNNGICHVIGPDFPGKACGTDAMNVLLHFIFNYINVNKVKPQVFGYNKRAISPYRKCGFQLGGT